MYPDIPSLLPRLDRENLPASLSEVADAVARQFFDRIAEGSC